MVNVAVCQFAPGEDKRANLAQVGELLDQAGAAGAEVAVLPEYSMFTVPVIDERFVASAEPLDGEFATGLRRLAEERGLTAVAGVNEALPGEQRISNTLVACGPDGEISAVYRKTHLYDAFGQLESNHVRAGALGRPQTFEAGGFTFGMQTCYDLRFPEVTRHLVDAGVNALLLPAAWVPGPLKEDHWRTLVRARAIENTIYVAAAGQSGPTGSGGSTVVDPMGVAVTSLGEQVGTAVGDLSRERLRQVRTKNPALELRRFDVTPRG